MSVLVLLLALLALTAIQAWTLRGFGRRVPVGDEKDYLARAAASDPYSPGFFLRPPGMAFVARRLGSERRLRGALALAGCATATLVAAAAWLSAGGWVALVAVFWMLLPERLFLACHVWPDTLLGLLAAGVVLVFALPGSGGPAGVAALAALALLGALVRVDFAAVAPLGGLGLAAAGEPPGPWEWLLLLAPTALAVALWTLRNSRRYGRREYDDTWAFNVMLAAEGVTASPRRREPALEPRVARVLRRWVELSPGERAASGRHLLVRLASRPLRLLADAVRRTLALVGPDTFVRQLLLPATAGYPELPAAWRRLLEPLLRLGFPLLATVCLLGALLTLSAPPAYLLPVGGTLIGGVVFHLRTRYRVVVMPALALWAAEVATGSLPVLKARSPGFVVLVAAIGIASVWLLGRIDHGRELPAGGTGEAPE